MRVARITVLLKVLQDSLSAFLEALLTHFWPFLQGKVFKAKAVGNYLLLVGGPDIIEQLSLGIPNGQCRDLFSQLELVLKRGHQSDRLANLRVIWPFSHPVTAISLVDAGDGVTRINHGMIVSLFYFLQSQVIKFAEPELHGNNCWRRLDRGFNEVGVEVLRVTHILDHQIHVDKDCVFGLDFIQGRVYQVGCELAAVDGIEGVLELG